jgi:hypothetical protein
MLRRAIIVLGLLWLGGVNMLHAAELPAIPARPFTFTGACAELNAQVWRSDACDAEIAANPVPVFEQPIEYTPRRDGEAHSRAILFPDEPLQYPIAWMKRNWYYADGPNVLPTTQGEWNKRFVDRYNMFYIYQVVEVDGALWYLVDVGKWIKDEYLSVLHVPPPPEGVSGQWIIIDLAQQVLIAMEDERPVWATLVSTGYWLDTTAGLFQIYARTQSMQMKGPPGANPPKYNFRTNWVMFFDEHQAVHSANFHNWFGLKRSHGCVNMVPGDAEWLWTWAERNIDEWHPSRTTFRVDFPEKAPHVLVYNSARLPETYDW